MGRMTKNLFYGISNFISRSYINLLHGNRLWVCLICVFLFLCFFITQSQVQHLTSNVYGTLLVSWPRPLIYILCMHKNRCVFIYLQQMTALHDRARSRKAWRTSKERAYLSVCPSMMSANSFSFLRESPSEEQWAVSVALVAWIQENNPIYNHSC